ncbi:transcription termination factor MTERF5, chloroplastic-like, partial [Jatropha curcas]|uniref:transcription termination factor MTERF5, chloroplastic-like n=1 Tax=Jatropha curcas TaxID=180498 RepID=UPI0005FBCDE5
KLILGVDGSFSSRVVPPTQLAAEKEEAKAVLTFFLKKQGLSRSVAARTINKSDLFIDHLVSRLHSVNKSQYLVGQELATLEIKDALIPYLECPFQEHGIFLADLVKNFPNLPAEEAKPVATVSPSDPTFYSKKLKVVSSAVSRVSKRGPDGKLPPHTIYLMDLGVDLEQLRGITRRFPSFAYYSLEGKIKPLVEFLLGLGVPISDLRTILVKKPQLCGFSLSETLIPTVTFLENLEFNK